MVRVLPTAAWGEKAGGRSSPTLSRCVIALALAGCTATISPVAGTNRDGSAGPEQADQVETAPAQGTSTSVVRRLTRLEYDNTVRDLLGDDSRRAADFPAEEIALGFDNNGAALTVPPLLAERYVLTAEKLAAAAVKRLDVLLPCWSASPDETCAAQLIRDFGQRAFRRPLSVEEEQDLLGLYRTGSLQAGASKGIELVLRGILTSAEFLFRFELGSGEPGQDGLTNLSSWELATRLSYLLWQSMPDAELFDAARSGGLTDQALLSAQAARLITDERARPAIADFHEQWLMLRSLDANLAKDATLFPEWTPELPNLLQQELRLLVQDIAYGSSDPVRDLVTSSYTFVNAPLASYYGLAVAGGGDFQRVALEPKFGAGVLSRAGLLAVHAHSNQSSPTLRGKLVRERFLCETLPPPPPTANNTPSPPSPAQTTRERLAQHALDPACSGCHAKMDPLGFAFESFDAAGRFRELENSVRIDTSGTLASGVDGSERTFGSIQELGQLLADSEQVRLCLGRQWFRFALGRAEQGEHDEQTIQQLSAALGPGGSVTKLLTTLIGTQPFLTRPSAALAGKP